MSVVIILPIIWLVLVLLSGTKTVPVEISDDLLKSIGKTVASIIWLSLIISFK